MRLTDLEPEWLDHYDGAQRSFHGNDDALTSVHRAVIHAGDEDYFPVTKIDQPRAQGVAFLCPVCFVKNNGPVGTEQVVCWFKDRGVPDDALPGPGRWTATGTSFADLTLSPSVNVDNGHWHGFIQGGEVK